MDILKQISRVRKEGSEFSGTVEEAVFIFNGVLGETLAKQPGFAGNAVKILAAFSAKPVQSNFYEVFGQERMSNLIPRLAVKTAVLCVPHKQAAYIAEQLGKYGITRILNWSGADLVSVPGVAVLNEEPPVVNSKQN